jgi:hypothetical protein
MCLANAFDNCTNADFGRLTEQFGGIVTLASCAVVLTRFTQKLAASAEPSNTYSAL